MSQIRIYKVKGKTEISVSIDKDTVWLSLKQITELFDRDKSVISRHIRNIFREGELDRDSVVAKNATTAADGKTYLIEFYNLDVIISVGYRVKSLRGTQFRIWANKILKEYLINGYALNQQVLEKKNEQLSELQETIRLIRASVSSKPLSGEESIGLLQIISDYSRALEILDQYDYQSLEIIQTRSKERFRLTYEEAMEQIDAVKNAYGNSELFGREKDKSFRSSIGAIYQTFDGKDLYPSIEEKAANLLYFITKNHSFTDGNKRIAAFLFLYFMDRNGILYDDTGRKRIADNALVALTLMIAVSKPDEKDTMTRVIVNLINKNN
ncbi:MAG: cytochrome C biogenesis protein CycH [Bacteroidetes bacterium]|nr:cytochrome C biogenesis protein CycH [Bacteroidota bacterium]